MLDSFEDTKPRSIQSYGPCIAVVTLILITLATMFAATIWILHPVKPATICALPPTPPMVCFMEAPVQGKKSWLVKHNVPYYNIAPPHVETNTANLAQGDMFQLVNLTIVGKSIQWVVSGCVKSDGSPTHFTVYYTNPIECVAAHANGTSKTWRC